MTNEISNKTLAFLLIGAIVVSLFGTFVSLNKLNKISDYGLGGITGLITDSGTVTLDVSGLESFNVYTDVDFGSIIPNATKLWATTNTTNNWLGTFVNDCSLPAGACQGLTIENDGNEVLNISFNTTEDAASLIGGTTPYFKFFTRNGNETFGEGGCDGNIIYNSSSALVWTEILADTDYVICNGTGGDGFDFQSGADTVTLEFNLTIPADAPKIQNSVADITIFNT